MYLSIIRYCTSDTPQPWPGVMLCAMFITWPRNIFNMDTHRRQLYSLFRHVLMIVHSKCCRFALEMANNYIMISYFRQSWTRCRRSSSATPTSSWPEGPTACQRAPTPSGISGQIQMASSMVLVLKTMSNLSQYPKGAVQCTALKKGSPKPVQSASTARSQGLVKHYCGSFPSRWAILQLLCSQARRKLQEELLQKLLETSYWRILY